MEALDNKAAFTFSVPFHHEEVEIKGQKHLFLEGIISTNDIDLVNDMVTKDCLDSMAKQIREKNLKLDFQHEAFRGDSVEEKEINKTIVPAGRMFDAEVKAVGKDKFALFVKSELNPFRANYEEIKGSIVGGFLDAYSIAFIPTKSVSKIIDGKSVRMLDGMSLLNVALTGNPINTAAQNKNMILKSIESLEDYKKEKKSNPDVQGKLEVKDKSNSSQIKNLGNDQTKLKEVKKMSEEENETKKVEEQPKPEEEKKDEESESSEESEGELAEEVKSLRAEIKSANEKNAALEKEVAEIKSAIKVPVRKSTVDVKDKSENFEVKSRNPLDLI